jgi:putative aldouronate transport system substrate-binding protein
LYLATQEYEKFKPEHIPPAGMYMTSEDSDTYAQLILPIQNQVYLNSMAFVAGELDIDTDWDAFVAGFDDLKVDEFVALLQKYYQE